MATNSVKSGGVLDPTYESSDDDEIDPILLEFHRQLLESGDLVTSPNKVKETTAHEQDKARSTPASEHPYDDYSTDEEEVDPVLEKEFYRQLNESDGFDVDITIPHNSFSKDKFEDDQPDSYRDMLDIYARVGLHWYNFHKGSNFQFSAVSKYISWLRNAFNYSITFEGMDPADKSSITFQAKVIRAGRENGEQLRIVSEGCRIKPQTPGTGDEIHAWKWPIGSDESYKGNLPKWYSDDALKPFSDTHHQFYQVQDSDIRENDWLNMYAEIALYSLHEGDTTLLHAWLPVEISKVVVQTYDGDGKSSKEKLKAGNAIFYIAFKNLHAPRGCLLQDHRAIVRRVSDGVPGHVSLGFKCWLQE
ncbi:unnamed protein product [Microthlaspi erraticum]|uniref:Uncharacterized protein n=1 Tax=Microthlaspi erraticum TaxID=1685480 RepID=A0A6D2IGN9_9BRAS|nr:unnamed protein product [Microthlaspi erraticum]